MIDITLLGTAALCPLPERALSSAVLSYNGRSILFDCGEGTQTAVRRWGLSLVKTDLIALTHYHGDHFFGLPGLLQTMYCLGRTEPLYITGPEGLYQAMQIVAALAGRTNFELRALTLDENGIDMKEINPAWGDLTRFEKFETKHRSPSCGYSFILGRAPRFMPEKAKELDVPVKYWNALQHGTPVEFDGRNIFPEQVTGGARKGLKFAFTGDTSYCDTLINGIKDADLVIADGTYGENEQDELAVTHGHMNFKQAARAARDANAKKLVLTHYSQMIEDPNDCLPNARAVFENTLCGYDGMKLKMEFEG